MTKQVDIPSSSSTVSVSIIDSTARLSGIATSIFIGPSSPAFETFSCTGYAFLITHINQQTKHDERLVFDLGPPPDWRESLPREHVERVQGWIENGASIHITKHVQEILVENGVTLTSDDRIIWSHPHWDHIGRPSLFPKDIPLIVGPDMKTLLPGWPENPNAGFKSIETEGREVIELGFNEKLVIGGLLAIDYFGDGSFYLLDAPGHCIGHINALARVSSNPDRFILMGADSFHHGSQIRPNEGNPLPALVNLGALGNLTSLCPCEDFLSVYPSAEDHQQDRYTDFCKSSVPGKSPFFTISQREDGTSVAVNLASARQTVKHLQTFDADERILVVGAHDASLLNVLEFFPKPANDWWMKGWKEKGQWLFLKDFAATSQFTKS